MSSFWVLEICASAAIGKAVATQNAVRRAARSLVGFIKDFSRLVGNFADGVKVIKFNP
jgi:hypothetical protein